MHYQLEEDRADCYILINLMSCEDQFLFFDFVGGVLGGIAPQMHVALFKYAKYSPTSSTLHFETTFCFRKWKE